MEHHRLLHYGQLVLPKLPEVSSFATSSVDAELHPSVEAVHLNLNFEFYRSQCKMQLLGETRYAMLEMGAIGSGLGL